MHRYVRNVISDIVVGDLVSYRGIRGAVVRGLTCAPSVDGPDEDYMGIVQAVGDDLIIVSIQEAHTRATVQVVVPWSDYLCSHIASPDLRLADVIPTWTECEKHYGINYHGSHDPCPIRQLAFMILRGDPMALDAARDILKI